MSFVYRMDSSNLSSENNYMSGEGETCYGYKPTEMPYKVDPHLDSMDISREGYLLLCTSNLTGRYWNGSTWVFKEPELAPIKEKSLSSHSCESGVVTGKFLDSYDKLVIGEDSGAITVLSLETFENNEVRFVIRMYAIHHDSSILSLAVSQQKDKTISAGMDSRINVWDNQVMEAEHMYFPAHSKAVTSVSSRNGVNSFQFASCSLDQSALLWDPRLSKPASVLKENYGCGLTSILWKDDNEIIVGSKSGEINVFDIRSHQDLLKTQIFNRPIHNMVLSSNRLLAICGDTNKMNVWDLNSNTLVYNSVEHSGFVRSVAWHPKTQLLYSCGYDHKVIAHNVPQATAA